MGHYAFGSQQDHHESKIKKVFRLEMDNNEADKDKLMIGILLNDGTFEILEGTENLKGEKIWSK